MEDLDIAEIRRDLVSPRDSLRVITAVHWDFPLNPRSFGALVDEHDSKWARATSEVDVDLSGPLRCIPHENEPFVVKWLPLNVNCVLVVLLVIIHLESYERWTFKTLISCCQYFYHQREVTNRSVTTDELGVCNGCNCWKMVPIRNNAHDQL